VWMGGNWRIEGEPYTRVGRQRVWETKKMRGDLQKVNKTFVCREEVLSGNNDSHFAKEGGKGGKMGVDVVKAGGMTRIWERERENASKL